VDPAAEAEMKAVAGGAVETESNNSAMPDQGKAKYMKRSYRIAAVIIIAVLLAALSIGLVIRQVRLHYARAAAEQNRRLASEKLLPGGRRVHQKTTDEDRAKIKQEREEAIKKHASMSEQEKEKLTAQMRADLRTRFDGGSRPSALSEDEKAKLAERWQNMTEEEREALKAKIKEQAAARRQRIMESPNDVSSKEKSEAAAKKTDVRQQDSPSGQANK
jgi:hypothetical protein